MGDRVTFQAISIGILFCLACGAGAVLLEAAEEPAAALAGKRVAILVAEDYEDIEVLYPMYRLQEEGAEVVIVGGWRAGRATGKHGWDLKVDVAAGAVNAEDLEALIVPGGWAPDALRTSEAVLALVRSAFERGKVVAAICHGPSVLVSADVLKGKKATCWKSIKDDVVNAGATFVDEPVVVDGNLITSRYPPDLPQFCRAIIKALSGAGTEKAASD